MNTCIVQVCDVHVSERQICRLHTICGDQEPNRSVCTRVRGNAGRRVGHDLPDVEPPEVADTLHTLGPQAGRAVLAGSMADAASFGLLAGSPEELAEQFAALLWGNLMISLSLRAVDPPGPDEIALRAGEAATAFLRPHPAG